jgi:hypothetical protein
MRYIKAWVSIAVGLVMAAAVNPRIATGEAIDDSPRGAIQAADNCITPTHRLPAPLVGRWREYTAREDGEVLEGELQSEIVAGGCAFVQRFVSVGGEFTFRSLGNVDTASGRWRERFVLSNGRTAEYEWTVDSDDILLVRLDAPDDALFRLRLTKIGEDSYEVWEERSGDGGDSWVRGEVTVARRVGPTPPIGPPANSSKRDPRAPFLPSR